MRPSLLPAGCYDLLSPMAERQRESMHRVLSLLRAHGYEETIPPLLEFESGLFSGQGEVLSTRAFRVLDSESQRMMGIRADFTPQIARIATTRLHDAPRPLRLCYAGRVLRALPEALGGEREIVHVGAELIGSDAASADAEAIVLASSALEAIGLGGLTVDLALPTLPRLLLEAAGLGGNGAAMEALARKDSAALAHLPGGEILSKLARAAGPVNEALRAIETIGLPAAAAPLLIHLKAVIAEVQARRVNLALTLDPLELQGFEYHQGVCFSLFALGFAREAGRGGRYILDGKTGEQATGFTLYLTPLLPHLPPTKMAARVYLPHGTSAVQSATLQADGFVTVSGLTHTADPQAEARRLHCTHWWNAQHSKAMPV